MSFEPKLWKSNRTLWVLKESGNVLTGNTDRAPGQGLRQVYYGPPKGRTNIFRDCRRDS